MAFTEGDGSWAVSAEIEGMLGLATLGTGIEPPAGEETARSRQCRIDREPVGSAAAFADHLRVVWLTPAMDQLFTGPASERRRFLDRLVLAVDAEHSSRVSALERCLRSRNRLLEEQRPDPHWLDAIEHETAELAVAVAAAAPRRCSACRARSRAQGRRLSVGRDRARRLDGKAAAEPSRGRDRGPLPRDPQGQPRRATRRPAARSTDRISPTSRVVYAPKSIPAADASTGEQKALLIGLVLAHAGLLAEMTGFAPVLLLDEVVAHLDPGRRAALYDALGRLGAQVWMTGADPAAFADVAARADVFAVSSGPRAARR